MFLNRPPFTARRPIATPSPGVISMRCSMPSTDRCARWLFLSDRRSGQTVASQSSQRQVEGQNKKVKLVKRMGYRRANFDLRHKRILLQA
jgi:transposase